MDEEINCLLYDNGSRMGFGLTRNIDSTREGATQGFSFERTSGQFA